MKRLWRSLPVLALLASAPAQADFLSGARAYQEGDFAAAVREWGPLSTMGDPRAQYNMGILYSEGRGLPVDIGQARILWERAAAQNYAPALHNLAMLYIAGDGVPQNFATARELLIRAAAQAQPNSMYTLGKMYAESLGGSQDIGEAFKMFSEAAKAGHARAQYNLGKFYRDGAPGLPVDMAMAAQWFRRAAEQGHVLAQSRYANRLALGEGVPRDDVEALKWAMLAAAQGEESAIGNEAALRARMTSAQIAAAEARAKAVRPPPSP